MTTTPQSSIPALPELRPVRLQGTAYYDELNRLLRQFGRYLLQDAIGIKTKTNRFEVQDLVYLALRYRLNIKATCEYLEEHRFLPCGAYQRLLDRKFKPMYVAKQVWSEHYQELS